ncbi:NTP transferase domain-containing protein [uncultured Kriegella sp.]|uniref:cytidylyltransferase domain-containing protein n=1 Tax=uncultured Kriegella sp. TaxID=1798910 RepID=UPI0030D82936|tara:strand:+ start:157082 stop:157915 length:834 start_codon:yes stop_codon:yes gene_type:complete
MKIGYFITARLKSSRLKQKILLPLHGATVLDHVINRCKQVNGIDDIVLCTSTNPQDAKLYNYALDHKIKFYAGSEDDVLKRLLDAAKYFGFDAFVSITADNPLHSIYVANLIVDWVTTKPADFVFTSGLPIGLTPYFLNTKALEIAVGMKEKTDSEIWGPFVNRPDFFKIGYLDLQTSLFDKDIRLTCDYIDDYEVMVNIFSQFGEYYEPSIFEVSKLFREGKVLNTNGSITQAAVPLNIIADIKETFDQRKERGMKIAEKIQHDLIPGENKLKIEL